MTAKMTKTQKIARANEYRARAAEAMGAISSACGECNFGDLGDEIMNVLSLNHFADGMCGPFDSLCGSYTSNGYTPTLRGDLDPLYTVLADMYDFKQAQHRRSARAYRGN